MQRAARARERAESRLKPPLPPYRATAEGASDAPRAGEGEKVIVSAHRRRELERHADVVHAVCEESPLLGVRVERPALRHREQHPAARQGLALSSASLRSVGRSVGRCDPRAPRLTFTVRLEVRKAFFLRV